MRREPYPVHTTIIDDAEEKAVVEVLRSGHLSGFSAKTGERFLGGEKVREMEEDFARYFGVEYAVSFNSATSALHGAMAAVGIGPGDEVITSPYTMSATASSIIMTNGVPVFADIEESTFGLDPDSVEQRITPSTKAILAVNIFGHPCRLGPLKELADRHGLMLVEDNAQAPGMYYHGKRCGTVGEMGVLSLNYHKAIQTGEGGMVVTDNRELAERLQLIRNHGEVVVGQTSRKDITNLLGWNYRLTEIQAAVGIEQLKKLDAFNRIRQDLAGRLTALLGRHDFLVPPVVEPEATHGYYLFPIRFFAEKIGISRQTFVAAMQAEGISLAGGYVRPIYLEPMFQEKIAYGRQHCPFGCSLYKGTVSYEKGICPTAERMHFAELMTTDICKFPNSKQEVDEFGAAVDKVVANLAELRSRAE